MHYVVPVSSLPPRTAETVQYSLKNDHYVSTLDAIKVHLNLTHVGFLSCYLTLMVEQLVG
jgi:hypothetical protein